MLLGVLFSSMYPFHFTVQCTLKLVLYHLESSKILCQLEQALLVHSTTNRAGREQKFPRLQRPSYLILRFSSAGSAFSSKQTFI